MCTPTRRLTYREVYRYACRIEQELLRCQVQPNELVAVMMEKGWEQIVAVLGIHFAGAAYLPIDPELPAERQRFLLEHAKVKVALTQARVRNRLSVPASVEVFEVDRAAARGSGNHCAGRPAAAETGRSRLRDLHLGFHGRSERRDDRSPRRAEHRPRHQSSDSGSAPRTASSPFPG